MVYRKSYTQMCLHTHTHTYIYIYIHKHVCIFIYKQTYTHSSMCFTNLFKNYCHENILIVGSLILKDNCDTLGNSGFLRFSGGLVSFRKLGQLDLYILL